MGTLSRRGDALAGSTEEASITAVPWLDNETAALLRATITAVARQHSTLRAAVLYGSIARHDERPLTDQQPSDVDLLLVFARRPGQAFDFNVGQMTAIFGSINEALMQHPDSPREVRVMLATEDFADWDDSFVRNVLHDGLVLWARGELGDPLAGLAAAATT